MLLKWFENGFENRKGILFSSSPFLGFWPEQPTSPLWPIYSLPSLAQCAAAYNTLNFAHFEIGENWLIKHFVGT